MELESWLNGLQCFICLEVFTDPVTTPCGHTFCRVCINQHWNNNRPYTCPLCKHKFSSRPDLQINPALAMIVNELKNGAKMRDTQSCSLHCLKVKQGHCTFSVSLRTLQWS
uniref:RING-type domain-containing protein n=1 Tax=Periophthalmus magnuspinnatus TaxID=409849 RepID=A0A3B4BFT3_9GOBI